MPMQGVHNAVAADGHKPSVLSSKLLADAEGERSAASFKWVGGSLEIIGLRFKVKMAKIFFSTTDFLSLERNPDRYDLQSNSKRERTAICGAGISTC